MKDRDSASTGDTARGAREKRLAEALRANLRRRKTAGRPQTSSSGAENGDGAGEKLPNSNENEG